MGLMHSIGANGTIWSMPRGDRRVEREGLDYLFEGEVYSIYKFLQGEVVYNPHLPLLD